MRKTTIEENKKCAECEHCKKLYILEPKRHACVFVCEYNRFGVAKYEYRLNKTTGELPFSVLDFL